MHGCARAPQLSRSVSLTVVRRVCNQIPRHAILTMVFVLVASTLSFGQPLLSRDPKLGDPFPCDPWQVREQLLVASAQTAPACDVTLDGATFTVARGANSRIIYVAVSDTRYRTLEGIHPGSSLADVLKAGAPEPLAEVGWAFHTRLASGWNAAFVNGPNMTREPLPPHSKVLWLFKR